MGVTLLHEAGKRFGRLVVQRRAENHASGNAQWLCLCDCGTEKLVTGSGLASGRTKSCGCLRKERNKTARKTHGMCYSLEYGIWGAMMQRCYNTANKQYMDYGGRGITVCKRWHKFENFYADMKSRPSAKHMLERVENHLGYSYENCIWALRTTQANNKRNNRLIALNGRKQTLAQWCRELGVKYSTASNRLNRYGWSEEEALLGRRTL